MLAGASTSAWAQTGTASVYGEIVDPQQQVVPGVTVTITHIRTGVVQTTVTDERGAYRAVALPPGTYNM